MLEIVFVLSVLGNGWQWLVTQEQAEQIETLQTVNKENADITSDISTSLEECSGQLVSWRHKESDWKIERESSQQRLNELSRDVDSIYWGDCRSPVDLEL